jgi:hypothetical protein
MMPRRWRHWQNRIAARICGLTDSELEAWRRDYYGKPRDQLTAPERDERDARIRAREESSYRSYFPDGKFPVWERTPEEDRERAAVLTPYERARWGRCPICNVSHGEACDSQAVHGARLAAAPLRRDEPGSIE